MPGSELFQTIIYSDNSLLVVNKPAGLRTIPDGYDPTLPHLSGSLTPEYGRVWTVHRLDKDTSGVIVFARSAESHRSLNAQFSARETRKEYHALVVGLPAWDEQQINLRLRVNGDRRHRTVVDAWRGKPATTSFTVLARYPAYSLALISAQPHTGYTHQIRAHLAAIQFPVLADALYRAQLPFDITPPPLPITRTALHAFR